MTSSSNSEANKERYVEGRVKGYIEDIFAMVESYVKSASEYLVPFIELSKVKKYEEQGLKTKLMLLLSKYGSKDALEDEVAKFKENVKNAGEKLNQILSIAKSTLESKSFQCTNCNGTGRITKVRYIREGPTITPFFDMSECPLCKGKATMEIPDMLQDYLSISVKAAETTARLGATFIQSLEDVSTMFQTART